MAHVCVTINLHALGLRLAAQRGKPVPLGDIHAWLGTHGFVMRGHWHCDGGALHHLRPDEILATITKEKIEGVTFVKHDPPPP